MKRKQYTLTFFLCTKDGSDVLENVNCDQWFEITEEGIIYCINDAKTTATCYLKSNLRRAVEHYYVDTKEIISPEKTPEGYN